MYIYIYLCIYIYKQLGLICVLVCHTAKIQLFAFFAFCRSQNLAHDSKMIYTHLRARIGPESLCVCGMFPPTKFWRFLENRAMI